MPLVIRKLTNDETEQVRKERDKRHPIQQIKWPLQPHPSIQNPTEMQNTEDSVLSRVKLQNIKQGTIAAELVAASYELQKFAFFMTQDRDTEIDGTSPLNALIRVDNTIRNLANLINSHLR